MNERAGQRRSEASFFVFSGLRFREAAFSTRMFAGYVTELLNSTTVDSGGVVVLVFLSTLTQAMTG